MFCHKTKKKTRKKHHKSSKLNIGYLGPHLSICLKKKNHKSTKLNTGYLVRGILMEILKEIEEQTMNKLEDVINVQYGRGGEVRARPAPM